MPVLPVPFLRGAARDAWLSVGAPIFGLVFLVILVALALLFSFAQAHDREFRDSSRQLVSSAFAARATALADLTRDFAVWDDAHDALARPHIDASWLENNYYSNVADALIVFRPGQTTRYAWIAEPQREAAGELLRKTRRAVARLDDLDDLIRAQTSANIVAPATAVIDGELALIAVAPIVREDNAERRAQVMSEIDYLAIVTVLEPGDVAEMGMQLNLDAMAFSESSAALPRNAVLLPIMAGDGAITGYLTWRDLRPGSAALLGMIWLVVPALLLAGLLAFLIARRLIARQMRGRVHAEAALESSRLKSEFIATMSHELRTPLNAIIGYAELIQEEKWSMADAASTQQDAGRILTAARHLNRLVNDVLDQSRLDAGRLPLAPEPIDVADLLAEVFEIVEPLAQAKANSLIMRTQPDMPRALADHMRLRQCLLNLVSNAIKFTDRGAIMIMARAENIGGENMIVIDVADTGIGIARTDLEAMFEPFVQANPNMPEGGAGLGLAISRKLARAMGGDITAVSELSKGATFTLSTPAAAVALVSEAA